MPSRPRRQPAPGRRTLLVGALGAGLGLGLTACSTGSSTGAPTGSSTGSSTGPATSSATSAASGSADADLAAARQAVAQIETRVDLIRRATTRWPGLRGALTPLQQMHDAHLTALGDAVSDAPSPGAAPTPARTAVPGSRAAARSAVVAAEHDLEGILTGLAAHADSGAFARLLGSMSASIAQHLEAL